MLAVLTVAITVAVSALDIVTVLILVIVTREVAVPPGSVREVVEMLVTNEVVVLTMDVVELFGQSQSSDEV